MEKRGHRSALPIATGKQNNNSCSYLSADSWKCLVNNSPSCEKIVFEFTSVVRFGLLLSSQGTEKKRRCLHFIHHVDKCWTSKFWTILPLHQVNVKQCQSPGDSYTCIFHKTTLCILDLLWKLQLVGLKSNLQHEQLASADAAENKAIDTVGNKLDT